MRYFIFCLISISVFACNQGVSTTDVERLGTQLFVKMQKKEFKEMLDYYDPEFFLTQSRDQWSNKIETLIHELGDVKSFKLIHEQADTRFSGEFFIQQYYVEHDRGRSWHTLTLQNPTNTNSLRLIGHKIEQKGNK